jgi:transposase InsO family protein
MEARPFAVERKALRIGPESSVGAGRVGPLVTRRGTSPPQELAAGFERDQVSGRNSISAPFRECLDWTLVFGRRHLEYVLREYVGHYNERRPHRGLGLRAPDPPLHPPAPLRGHRSVRRRDLLGGLVHEYELAA